MDENDRLLLIKRQTLIDKLDEYYKSKEYLLDIQKEAVNNAITAFQLQISRKQDIELEELRNILILQNENKSSSIFIFEIALSIILGPALGHIIENTGKSMVRKIIESGKKEIDAVKVFTRDAKVAKEFAMDRLETGQFMPGFKFDDEETLKIAKEIRRLSDDLEKANLHAVSVKEKILPYELIDHVLPAGNDIFQAAFSNFFSPEEKETAFKTLNSLYASESETMSLWGKNVNEIISDMQEDYSVYRIIQSQKYDLRISFFKFIIKYIDSGSLLDTLTEFCKILQKFIVKNKPVELLRTYKQMYEALFWILYLGDPDRWIKTPMISTFRLLDENELVKYNPHAVGKDKFKLSVGQESVVFENLPKYWSDVIPKYNSGQSALFTVKINSKIPMELLHYLSTNFGYGFGEVKFYTQALSMKREFLNKKEGFGITIPAPIPYHVVEDINTSEILNNLYGNHFVDATIASLPQMVGWFKIVNNALGKDTELKSLLKDKKFDVSFVNKFSLP